MISATEADLNSFTRSRFYSHERHALIPISPVFISARRQSWQSRRPLFDLDQTKSKHGILGNLCRSTPLGPAVEIAETGPFPGHYWHAEWVIRKYRINWDAAALAKGPRRNLFVLISRKIISAIQSLADCSSK